MGIQTIDGRALCGIVPRVADRNSYTFTLSADEQRRLGDVLANGNYEPIQVPYSTVAARNNECSVTLFQSSKCLVQGKGAADFVRFVLEPTVLLRAELDYKRELDPQYTKARIGVDESGKGDFFGPLVIAAAYADSSLIEPMEEMNVRDSKRITSDDVAMDMGEKLRRLLGKRWSVVAIGPPAYNRLYGSMRSVNAVLAWGHARAIENVLAVQPDCPLAISDQFGDEKDVKKALMQRGRKIELIQRHRAESDLAVAAASIIARDAFLRALLRLKQTYNMGLPKGASAAVGNAAVELVRRHGPAILLQTAKCHFRTTDGVLKTTGHTRSDIGPDGTAVSRPSKWSRKPEEG
jgi:ribonuclease HIII